MTKDIIKRYREHRKPYYSKYFVGASCAPAFGSLRAAKSESAIAAQWDRLEALNMVRLQWKPDECNSWDDLEGDCYSVKYNADSVSGGARTILAQQKEFRRTVEREGVWGLVGEFTLDDCDCSHPEDNCHCGADWINGGSVWGIVGQESDDYVWDIKAETIDALKAALRNRPVIARPNRLRAVI